MVWSMLVCVCLYVCLYVLSMRVFVSFDGDPEGGQKLPSLTGGWGRRGVRIAPQDGKPSRGTGAPEEGGHPCR